MRDRNKQSCVLVIMYDTYKYFSQTYFHWARGVAGSHILMLTHSKDYIDWSWNNSIVIVWARGFSGSDLQFSSVGNIAVNKKKMQHCWHATCPVLKRPQLATLVYVLARHCVTNASTLEVSSLRILYLPSVSWDFSSCVKSQWSRLKRTSHPHMSDGFFKMYLCGSVSLIFLHEINRTLAHADNEIAHPANNVDPRLFEAIRSCTCVLY